MTDDEIALAMAKAHVAEFEARVERQEALVAVLAEAGPAGNAGEARQVLACYRETLNRARDALRRLREGSAGG